MSKLDVFEKYGFDEALETEGVWRYLATNADGSQDLDGPALLIAAFGNEESQQVTVELRDRHLKELEAKTPEAKKLSRQLLVQMLARTILLGWKNLTMAGEDVTYSQESAIKLLNFRRFREQVIGLALDEGAYRAKVAEEDVKNS